MLVEVVDVLVEVEDVDEVDTLVVDVLVEVLVDEVVEVELVEVVEVELVVEVPERSTRRLLSKKNFVT